MSLYVSVKEITRLPAYKDEFLVTVAKAWVRSSMSNMKRLNIGHRQIAFASRSDYQHHKK